jgi:heme/copper-type cytochrome/quinol oxidase subunit 1
VLIGGALFPLFGAFHYWFPKITGHLMNEAAGKLSFWLLFIGFNVTFFPMHILGLYGMTRRIYTYPAEMGWGPQNLLATLGACVLAIGGMVFLYNVFSSLQRGPVAGDNPWDAGTLEWGTTSPPPPYNFEHQPVLTSRYFMWTPPEERVMVIGMRNDRREVLATTSTDAEPQFRMVLPGDSIWPFLTALGSGIGLAGSVFNFGWYYLALFLGGVGLIGWFWPRRPVEIEP